MRYLFNLLATAATALLVSACEGPRADNTGNAPAAAEAGGVAVVCAQDLPNVLNPFVTPDQVTSDLRWLLFTPIARYDTAGGVQPHLAQRWMVEDAGRTVIITIRDDVRWHDGRPLTAHDVVWTLQSAANLEYGYPSHQDFASLAEVSAHDSLSVILRFAAPLAAGLEPFTRLVVLPKHLLEATPPAEFGRAEFNRAPIGSGPYRFGGRNADGSINLDRVSDYPEELGRGLLDRYVLRELPEDAALAMEWQTGGVDGCLTGPATARQLQGAGGLSLPVPPAGVEVIPLNNRKPPLDDARVRRALSAAINRAELAHATSPIAQPAGTFLPAGDTRWLDPALLQPDNDTAEAVRLLTNAGWSSIDRNGIRRNAGGAPLRFTVVAPPTSDNRLTVLQAQLRRVGVDMQLRFMEGSSFFAMLGDPAARPEAMALVFIPDRFLYPDAFAELHSTGYANLANYSNARVDSLTQRLHDGISDDERHRIYRELQQRVAEDVPTLYTIYLPRVLTVAPHLRGVRVDLNGPFVNMTEWWIPAAQRRRRPTSAVGLASPQPTSSP